MAKSKPYELGPRGRKCAVKLRVTALIGLLWLSASAVMAANLGYARLELAKQMLASDDLQSARRLAEQAAEEFERDGKRGEAGFARMMAGGICETLAAYDCALRNYRASAAAAEQAGEPGLARMPWLLTYQVMMKKGDLLEALAGVTRLKDEFERLNIDPASNATLRGKIAQMMGLIHSELGNYDAALALLDKAQGALAGDKIDLAQTLAIGGAVATGLGWHEEAERRYEAALQLLSEVERGGPVRYSAGLSLGVTKIAALLGLSNIELHAGRHERSILRSGEAVQVALASGRKREEAHARAFHAVSLLRAGRATEAAKEIDVIEKIAAETGDAASDVLAGVLRASFFASENPQRALSGARRALQSATRARSPQGKAWAYAAVGNVLREMGENEHAITAFEQAVVILEETKNRVVSPDAALALAGTPKLIYESLIRLLVKKGDVAAAFNYAERYRASLFLRLATGGETSGQGDEYAALATSELAARQRLVMLEKMQRVEVSRQDAQPSDEVLRDLSRRMDHAKGEYARVVETMRSQAPALAARRSVFSLSAEEVQRKVLSEHDTLIEYYVFNDLIMTWVMDKSSIYVNVAPIKRTALERDVESFRQSISRRATSAQLGQALYDVLIRPVRSVMKRQRVILVPHGALHHLPFAALQDRATGRYLFEDYGLSTSPSASALLLPRLHRSENRWRALVLGDPNGSLPSARNEALEVGRQLNVQSLLDSEATETEVRRKAPSADIVHLAAHGTYRRQAPMFSSLNLAKGGGEDGSLEVHEIFRLNLREANLVVLSACESGLGHVTEGEEVIGFVGAVLHAGAASVVSTLWLIDDRASAALMVAFYSEWRKGMSSTTALQAAQRSVMAHQGARWRDPYYWSGFTLTGRD